MVLWSVEVIHLTTTLPLRSADGVTPGCRRRRDAGACRGAVVIVVYSSSPVRAVARQVLVRVVLVAELTVVAGVAQGLDVRVVVRLRTTLTVEEHERVVLAAELGALALVRRRLGRREGHVVGLAGDHVLLVQEVDDPERVDDVARLELDLRPSCRPAGTARAAGRSSIVPSSSRS